MNKTWLLFTLCSASFGGPITYTYNYVGNTVDCSYGTCPADIKSDYATASVTLTSPAPLFQRVNWLAPSNQSSLFSWTLGDALGYISLASTDANASSEIRNLAFNGIMTSYALVSATPNNLVAILNPAIDVPAVGGGTYRVADHLQAPDGSWQGTSAKPGHWYLMINGEQGGPASAPVLLTTGLPVTGVSATTSGSGSTDYYSFYWAGGAFSAGTVISNILSAGDSFQFSLGLLGSCNTLANTTLDGTNNYTGSISQGNLSAGNYCIGIAQTAGLDPNYMITFDTPLSAAPEPAAFLLAGAGLAVLCAVRRVRLSTGR